MAASTTPRGKPITVDCELFWDLREQLRDTAAKQLRCQEELVEKFLLRAGVNSAPKDQDNEDENLNGTEDEPRTESGTGKDLVDKNRTSSGSSGNDILQGKMQRSGLSTSSISLDFGSGSSPLTSSQVLGQPWYTAGSARRPKDATLRAGDEVIRQARSVKRSFSTWIHHFQEPERSGRAYDIVTSTYFGFLTSLVIFLQCAFIVITTDYDMAIQAKLPQASWVVNVEQNFDAIEACFMAYYILELALKMYVHGWYFFCNNDMTWNVFDFFIVLLGLLDILILQPYAEDGGMDITFLRSLRLVKMSKIIRTVRIVQALTELRIMLDTLVSSFFDLFWGLTLIAFILFLFALFFVQAATIAITDKSTSMDPEKNEEFQHWYGSVGTTSVTLFQAATGGNDWAFLYELMDLAGRFYGCVFVFYICFFQFSVVNIVTSIFVDKASKAASPDYETLTEEENGLAYLMASLDIDGDGLVTWDEFERCWQNRPFQEACVQKDILHSEVEQFFRVLNRDFGEGAICIQDFVHFITRMKGTASASDLHSISFRLLKLQQTMNNFESEHKRLIEAHRLLHRCVQEKPKLCCPVGLPDRGRRTSPRPCSPRASCIGRW